MWELTKSFRFEAAHSLKGTTFGAASEEIHGHSFRAEVSVRGTPDPQTGMVVDLGLLERSMEEVRKTLDHKLLNNV
jgi:6-pyruvoyltetrahydropterin/6-carboxytetrahydropterin synthase